MKPLSDKIKIFVTYSHDDSEYLKENSLLGFFKGLEENGIEFWTDQKLRPGEKWDEVIKVNLKDSQIALVLVSQSFLDSKYCTNVEIKDLLAHEAHLFPIILSPCDWQQHEWLKSRQFMPSGDETIEEHYTDSGKRKRLFLEIRKFLGERIEKIRNERKKITASPSPDGLLL